MIYTNVEERKAADEYLRFELEGRLGIYRTWIEMWTELTEHLENTDHRDIWYQDEKKNWKKARKIDRRIYIPLSAYSMDINTYLTNEVHCVCNIAFFPKGKYETLLKERTERILEARLLYKITKVEEQ